MSTVLTLNPTWLRNRLAQLGLRQWWLAEQLGVDRKTVLRWVNGQVRSIQPAKAQALASVLNCSVDELLLHDAGAQLATAEDQRAATLAIAARCGDHALHGDALGSRANLQFWRGEWPAARASWQQALALSAWLTPRQRGALHSNLGASLVETGAVDEGRQQLQLALDCFDTEGTPMNHAIARAHLALAALLQGDADEAERQAQRAEAAAQRGDYQRGLALAPLLQALVAARRGQRRAAEEGLRQADERHAALGRDEAHHHLLAARAWRWLGDPAPALARAQQAVQRAASFPLERAAAWHEQALAEALLGRGDQGAAAHAEATALYRRCGADDRAAALTAAWPPPVPSPPVLSLPVTRHGATGPLP